MIRLWFESKTDKVIKMNTGLLEVHHREEWIPVCGDNWADPNSDVVCRQLGYERGKATTPTQEVMTYHSDTPTFFSNVNCTGSEIRLTACEWAWQTNSCSSKYPVFIQCE